MSERYQAHRDGLNTCDVEDTLYRPGDVHYRIGAHLDETQARIVVDALNSEDERRKPRPRYKVMGSEYPQVFDDFLGGPLATCQIVDLLNAAEEARHDG